MQDRFCVCTLLCTLHLSASLGNRLSNPETDNDYFYAELDRVSPQ